MVYYSSSLGKIRLIETFCIVNSEQLDKIKTMWEINRNILYCKSIEVWNAIKSIAKLIETFCIVN